MISTLKDHPIWHNLTHTLKQLDPNQIAIQHLQACNAQISGYWDEDEFYEVVTFTRMPHPELVSSSLGISPAGTEDTHWLQLKFTLTANSSDEIDLPDRNDKNPVGELILILDENLEVVDENWLIDVNSLCIMATR